MTPATRRTPLRTVRRPVSEPNWQKAAPEDWDGDHIDVAIDEEAGLVRLRESRHPEVVVTTTTAKWNAFVLGVQAGEFDHFVEGVDDIADKPAP
jgi:hypothetical protein